MADNTYPIPSFYFKVTVDDVIFKCSEVSGLEAEFDVIDYRSGDSPVFGTQKIAGLRKGSEISLKRAVFAAESQFNTWFEETKGHSPVRKTVSIQLLDGSGDSEEVVMGWTISNAWPSKISAPEFKADSSELAVESITLVHEGIKLSEGEGADNAAGDAGVAGG